MTIYQRGNLYVEKVEYGDGHCAKYPVFIVGENSPIQANFYTAPEAIAWVDGRFSKVA